MRKPHEERAKRKMGELYKSLEETKGYREDPKDKMYLTNLRLKEELPRQPRPTTSRSRKMRAQHTPDTVYKRNERKRQKIKNKY